MDMLKIVVSIFCCSKSDKLPQVMSLKSASVGGQCV